MRSSFEGWALRGEEGSLEAKTRGVSMKRWVQAGLVCLLAVVMLGADPASRFNKMGHEMICTCRCGKVLLECNPVGCPGAPVVVNALHAQMGGGRGGPIVF